MSSAQHIELMLRDVKQLFNSLDPSPFREKDLDEDAAEFILSWAQEFRRDEPVDLVVHVETSPEEQDAQRLVEDGVHNYFAYRARLNELEFNRLMKQGRMSLIVGFSFLAACFLASGLIASAEGLVFGRFLVEGLTIAGWVAMWRPLQIYLYDWWPLRWRKQILIKLSRMPIEVRVFPA